MIPTWLLTVLAVVCFGLALLGKQRVVGGDSPRGAWRVLLSNGLTDVLPDAAWRGAYVAVGVALLLVALLM